MNTFSRITKLFLIALLAVSSVQMNARWHRFAPEVIKQAAKTVGCYAAAGAGLGFTMTQGLWGTVFGGILGAGQGMRDHGLTQKISFLEEKSDRNHDSILENGQAIETVQESIYDLSDNVEDVSHKVDENIAVTKGLCKDTKGLRKDGSEQYKDLLAKNLDIYDAVKINERLIKRNIQLDKKGFQAVLEGQEKIASQSEFFGIPLVDDQEEMSGFYSNFKDVEDEL